MTTETNPPGQVQQVSEATSEEATVEAAGATHVGLRRKTNEDAYLIGSLHRSLVVHEATATAQGWFAGGPAGTLLLVADGMGGQGGGEIASQTAVYAVTNYLLNTLPWAPSRPETGQHHDSLTGVRGRLLSAFVAGDATVKTAGAKTPNPRMGTTLTTALVLWPTLYLAHVGDTRCYLFRAGQLRRLTTDHNLAEQLAAADPLGEYAEHLQNVLWNMLGASDELPRPEITKLELARGDALLLCSDGLNKHVTDEQIQSVLASGAASRECCASLVDLALQGGGTDNVTVLVGRMQ